jgi:hypothetical protein
MSFQAYCPYCEKKMTAAPTSSDATFWEAIDSNADVEVMHVSPSGDHLWNLNHYEKENLRKKKAEGF